MSRPLRIQFEGALYHVTSRGNEQQAIFLDEHDYARRCGIPIRYESRNWDAAWFFPRTDGFVAQLIYDPYTLRYRRASGRYAVRWFVR